MDAAAREQSRQTFFEGIGHFEAGRLDEARRCFERCQALTPGRPSVLGNLGVTLFKLGRVREALPLLREAVVGEPQFRDAWVGLGLAHQAQGDWASAADALRRALALQDDTPALWFAFGECEARLARLPEALRAFDRALTLDPADALTWSVRGNLLREMKQLDAAARSFEKAIELGADPALHAYYLASVRGGPAPTTAPRQYVEALFDDYAADFQSHLLDQLGYRAFEVLLRPVVDSGRRFRAALDLGCGTGLCATLLQSCCDVIDGVDLSAKMLEQAARLGLYRELIHAELGEFLAATDRRADLVVAADVLIYVGDLDSVMTSVARLLEADGVFAFTVELSTDGSDLQLHPSLRYAHSERSVRRLAEQSGLHVDALRQTALRHEFGQAVQGLCVYLRASGAATRNVTRVVFNS